MRSTIMFAGLAAALAMICLLAFAAPSGGQQEEKLDKGFRIILAVYSGRPDPEWFVTDESMVEKISTLIRSLEISREPLFDYDMWNRLGFSGFWIFPKGMEGMPAAIHLWRDEAHIEQDVEGEERGYALGATELYDVLVELAERDDLGVFFKVYKREKEQRR